VSDEQNPIAQALRWLGAGYPDGIRAGPRADPGLLRRRLTDDEVQEVCEAVAAQTGADPEISLVDAQVLMMKVLGELPGDDDVERVRARLEESGITLTALSGVSSGGLHRAIGIARAGPTSARVACSARRTTIPPQSRSPQFILIRKMPHRTGARGRTPPSVEVAPRSPPPCTPPVSTAPAPLTAEAGLDAIVVGPGPDPDLSRGRGGDTIERLTALVIPATGDPTVVVPRMELAKVRDTAVGALGLAVADWVDGEDPTPS
jgi:hypothetical protein